MALLQIYRVTRWQPPQTESERSLVTFNCIGYTYIVSQSRPVNAYDKTLWKSVFGNLKYIGTSLAKQHVHRHLPCPAHCSAPSPLKRAGNCAAEPATLALNAQPCPNQLMLSGSKMAPSYLIWQLVQL